MRFFAACLCLIFLTGCPSSFVRGDPVPVHDRMPELDEPERPTLAIMTPEEIVVYKTMPEALRLKLQGNNEKIQIYAEKCAVAIREYNGFAKLRNKANGLWIKGGLKDEPVPLGK